MRLLAALALIASPAFGQEAVSYDKTLLTACLDRVASEHAQTDIEGDPRRACVGIAATACMNAEGGDTTVGMVQCMTHEVDQWDKRLNDAYQAVLTSAEAHDAELKANGTDAPRAASTLKQAQRSWISFRDESCKFEAMRHSGGSLAGPASVDCLLELTADQALRLMMMAGAEG